MSKLQVSIYKGAGASGIRLSREDADAIADHITCGYVVIPKSDLPEVQEGPHEHYARTVESDGTFESAFYATTGAPASNPAWHLARARHHIALATWLEANGESTRNRRREELAAELSPLAGVTFRELSPAACNAIDRIISLESAA